MVSQQELAEILPVPLARQLRYETKSYSQRNFLGAWCYGNVLPSTTATRRKYNIQMQIICKMEKL